MKLDKQNRIIVFHDGSTLPYSDYLDLELMQRDGVKLLNIKVKQPTSNMQEDDVDFEAIAFCARSRAADLKVNLSYLDEFGGWNGRVWIDSPIDFTKRERNIKRINDNYFHYSRFLYRAWKMQELYGEWFSVCDANGNNNKKEVTEFGCLYKKALEDKFLFFSDPDRNSGIKDVSSIAENHLEKWFVIHTHNDYKATTILQNKIKLFDQFPCGVLYGRTYNEAVHERNRIFNKGCFDLWGYNEGKDIKDIFLYELKEKENTNKLGIISELFFYSCLMQDFVCIAKQQGFKEHISRKRKFFRGLDEFAKHAEKADNVKAFFLVPGFHSFITGNINGKNRRNENMNRLLEVMNKRNDNVQYGCLWFKQEDIVGVDELKFIKKLKQDWDVFLNN